MKGVLIVLALLAVLLASIATVSANSEDIKGNINEIADKFVDIFEKKLCKMTEEEMSASGLTNEDIKRAKEFCNLPRSEKRRILISELKKAENYVKSCKELSASQITPYQQYCSLNGGKCAGGISFYNCWTALNVPCPRIFVSSCRIVQMPASCCTPGSVYCLWGCENPDPLLGFGSAPGEERRFNSVNEFRTYVTSKGYYESVFSYPERGIYDFTRDIGYGYRYEAWLDARSGRPPYIGRSEGPEPNPDPNWYGYLNGFWPTYSLAWHQSC
ncbi:hypothetical protein [Candidatus Methanodesulfokora washburnensis]|jgi:hypothetical protein|uniref:Uncharacterized protein n=1 Tax=Candidatus Methanodesulfokora washburnensis TaxID=2478471 RepID=A0A3R9X5W1_9CREN|nr:hypothetical protein [Candidatus Methanodesulfokores washburnensis]RSN76140.1 hypothetical protein D6D85_04085 [Candidatus Methanodesulfokores washburnensis]